MFISELQKLILSSDLVKYVFYLVYSVNLSSLLLLLKIVRNHLYVFTVHYVWTSKLSLNILTCFGSCCCCQLILYIIM